MRVLGLWCGGWCKGERCKVFVCFNNIQEMGVFLTVYFLLNLNCVGTTR